MKNNGNYGCVGLLHVFKLNNFEALMLYEFLPQELSYQFIVSVNFRVRIY